MSLRFVASRSVPFWVVSSVALPFVVACRVPSGPVESLPTDSVSAIVDDGEVADGLQEVVGQPSCGVDTGDLDPAESRGREWCDDAYASPLDGSDGDAEEVAKADGFDGLDIVGDAGQDVPAMPPAVTQTSCAALAGSHEAGSVVALGGSANGVCALTLLGGETGFHETALGSRRQHQYTLDPYCYVSRKWIGTSMPAVALQVPADDTRLYPKCAISSYMDGACAADWALVVGNDWLLKNPYRIVIWANVTQGSAAVVKNEAVADAIALVISDADASGATLIAFHDDDPAGYSAVLLAASTAGIWPLGKPVVLPGLPWSASASNWITGPVVTGAGQASAWIASTNAAGTNFVTRVGGQGMLKQLQASQPIATLPAALVATDDQIALLSASKGDELWLTVWGLSDGLRWSSKVMPNLQLGAMYSMASATYALHRAPGGGFFVLGHPLANWGGIALVQGGASTGLGGPGPAGVGYVRGGRHDRLVAAWFEHSWTKKPVVRIFDSFGNPSCDASGPCWEKDIEGCSDQNPCTWDRCDSDHNGCWHAPLPNGAWCGEDATCVAGVCTKS